MSPSPRITSRAEFIEKLGATTPRLLCALIHKFEPDLKSPPPPIHGRFYVFVDEVVGKEDFITYAAGIDATGRLGTLEVLAYRESHGGEIRGAAWRHQFDGRHGLERLRVQADIKNIAGATLSCGHVTQGVRWLVALWEVTLRPGAAPAA